MAYATVDELKDYLGITVTTDDALMQSLLDRATHAVKTYTGREFEAVVKTRYFEDNAVADDTLWVDDDLYSVTTLTNGDSSSTAIPSTEYWLIPRNDGPPYQGIRLKATSTYTWECDTDYFIIVAGKWGWSNVVPPDVQHATIRWAGYLYQQKDSPIYDTQIFPEAGVATIPSGIPADIRKLLDPFVRLVPR